MTVARWYTGHHVQLAALRAIAQNVPAAAISMQWTDGFEPRLPNPTTTYGGPFNAVPTNGGYYLRPTNPSDTARPLPFVEVYIDSQDPDLQSDAISDLVRVRIGVRAAIGGATATPITGMAIIEAQAMALCRLASVTCAEYLRGAALALNADGFGICWAQVANPPTVDVGGPQQVNGSGVIAASAVSLIDVVQRQFAPAGVGQTPLAP